MDSVASIETSTMINSGNSSNTSSSFGTEKQLIKEPNPGLTNETILQGVNNLMRSILPSLCSIPESQVILPVVSIVSTEGIKNGLPLVKLAISFAGCTFLRESARTSTTTTTTGNRMGTTTNPLSHSPSSLGGPAGSLENATDAEEFREKIKNVIVKLFDEIMTYGVKDLGRRFSFCNVDMSETEASMRAIFNGSCNGRPVHRESEVEILNLSRTKTSTQALLSLYRLCNLRELYLDHCPHLVEKGKQVFNLLQKRDPIPKLELLSIVETSSILSHTWLSEIQSSCPLLEKIYFTRKKGTKALGWHDSIMMQTMRKPHLLPCGHIGDRETISQVGYCSFDRQPFRVTDLLPLNPVITYLSKEKTSNGAWTAIIVDYHRQPLDSKVLYHHSNSCGCFFNLSTVEKIFLDIKDKTITDSLIQQLQGKTCPYCFEKMSGLRVCFPHSAEAVDSTEYNNLGQLGAYSVAGMLPAIQLNIKEKRN